MKNKLLCMLLVLCTVLAVFPVMAASANTVATATAPSYDSLYVENGLTIWLDAFDNSSANTKIDLANGKWYSKAEDETVYATIKGGVYSDSNKLGWKAGANGGIGWTQRNSVDGGSNKPNGLYFDTSLIPTRDYTVEILATTEGITTDSGERFFATYDTATGQGNIYGRGHGESIAVGTFRNYAYICQLIKDGSVKNSTDQLGYRWFLTGMNYGDHSTAYAGKDIFLLADGDKTIRDNYGVYDPYVLSLKLAWANPNSLNMRVAYDNVTFVQSDVTGADMQKTGALPNNNAGYSATGVSKPENVKFQLMVGMAGTIWSVRVYNRALNENEQWQNQFADVAKFYQLDLTSYATMSEEVKLYVHKAVGSIGFSLDKAAAQKALDDAARAYQEEQDRLQQEIQYREDRLEELGNRKNTDSYYVQNGLTIWLDAYAAYPELNTDIDLAAGKWYSKLDDGKYATIGGASYWSVSKDGQGIGYRLSKAEYMSSLVNNICPIGIEFDPNLLPAGDFTIETVATMVGLTNADGTRYTDPEDSPNIWGIYTAAYSSFSFGPFKAMTFLCNSNAERGTPMGHRWCYSKLEWGEHNGSSGYTDDTSLKDLSIDHPVAYDISCRARNSESDTYIVSINNAPAYTYNTPMIINDDAPEFNLFKGLASTVYTIRVYNRYLSDVEQAQNHVADLITFYGLNTQLFDLVLTLVEDKASFYDLFKSMGFEYQTKEAAQAIFDGLLAGTWLESQGLSFRLDNQAAVRAVFKLNPAAIAALEANNFKVEAGVLLDIGASATPVLGESDFRVVFRTKDGTMNNAFSIDAANNLMALTVNYLKLTPADAITDLSFCGYIALTNAAGEDLTLYVPCTSSLFDSNLFSGYEYLSRTDEYSKKFVKNVVDASYTHFDIELDLTAGDDANDGVNGPVKTMARAYELLVELLNFEAPVDVTLSFGEGKFVTEEPLELSRDQYNQRYVRLHYVGVAEDEDDDETFKTIITSNKELDNSGFTAVAGKPYYQYQFQKDADGNYPDFRLFYANGVAQEVAHHGYNRTYDAEYLGGGSHNNWSGVSTMWEVTELFNGVDSSVSTVSNPNYKLYLPKAPFQNLKEADLYKLEFHIPIAWYYRVLHIDRVDLNDVDSKGNVAVYFRAEDMQNWSAQHTLKGHYFWLENALSFVDEPGEFYYDDAKGTLYYYPAEGVNMATAEFEIPQAENLMGFSGVSNIEFKHLVFTGSDNNAFKTKYWGGQAATAPGTHFGKTVDHTKSALYIEDSKYVNLSYCIFRELGADAARFFSTTRNATIEYCRFYHIGSSAIHIGQHNGGWHELNNANENITITDNYLNDIAFMTRGSVACYMSVVKNYTLAYNTIMNTSYSAVSVGWRWAPAEWQFGDVWHVYNAEIYNNYFADFMTDQSDGGAIYTLGGNCTNDYHEYFNYLHDNFAWFTDKTGDGQGMVMPYYHDGASSNWLTYNNAEILHPLRKVHTTIYIQNIPEQHTHNILVEDNHIVANYLSPADYKAGKRLSGRDLEVAIFGLDGYQSHIKPQPTRVDSSRFLKQQNNNVYNRPSEMPNAMKSIIESAGSYYAYPDLDAIVAITEPLYKQYYGK